MKKLVFCLVLVMLVTGVVFAEGRPANIRDNWISGEINILGAGLRYERMLSENFSVGATLYGSTLIMTLDTSGIGAFARFYPFGKTFYLELGLGYGQNSDMAFDEGVTIVNADGTRDPYNLVKTSGLDITPGLGWRIDVGKEGGFFLNPGISLPVTIGKQEPWVPFILGGPVDWETSENTYIEKTGASVSFRLFLGMGYAF